MKYHNFALASLSAIALTLPLAQTASASEFVPDCHYDFGAKPDWPVANLPTRPIPVGVTMTPSGALVRLVPRKALKAKLKQTDTQEAWIETFAQASREAFKVHNRKAATGTPYDLKFQGQSLAVFRLFKKDWHLADDPFTTGYTIPVLANGYKTHSTPHYTLESPYPDKVGLMGFYQDRALISRPDCKYKYDINLDVTTNGFTTRVIIDPETETEGPIPY